MMKLPSLPYAPRNPKRRIEQFGGLNKRDGAKDNELALCENMSTRRYPALAPRLPRSLAGVFTRPTALYAWDELVVVDGTTLLYRNEPIGTVLPGRKQFAVVNSQLVIWPDKLALDLQNGTIKRMGSEISTVGTVTFTGDTITVESTDPDVGEKIEEYPYISSSPKLVKKYSALDWSNGQWVKTGETECTVDELAAGDYLIPSVSAAGDVSVRTRTDGTEYEPENDIGEYLQVTGKNSIGTTEYRWEKWSCGTQSSSYYYAETVDTTEFAETIGYTFYKNSNIDASGNFVYSGEKNTTFGEAYDTNYRYAGGGSRLYLYGRNGSNIRVAHQVVKIGTDYYYVKGSVKYDDVYGAAGAYPNNGRASDGYWYVLAGQSSFEGTVSLTYHAYVQGNPKLSDYFSKGAVLRITGAGENDKHMARVEAVSDYSVTFKQGTFTARTVTETVTMSDVVPDLDYICASNNRLWGVSNKQSSEIWDTEKQAFKTVTARTIWVSALGMPERFYDYEGLLTDSYAVPVGSPDDFTAICDYSGSVLCFKEDVVHRISGDYPSSYYMYTDYIVGVQEGSHKSLSVINDVLYYKGKDGVYRYSGGQPQCISYVLGEETFTNAVAGSLGTRYYISMRDSDDEPVLYVFDTETGLWMAEDRLSATDFARLRGSLYALSSEECNMYELDAGAEPVEWSLEFGASDEDSFDYKRYLRLSMDLELDADATLQVFASYDEGLWRLVHSEAAMPNRKRRHLRFPLPNIRCQRMRIRLAGHGDGAIYSMQREYAAGSQRR